MCEVTNKKIICYKIRPNIFIGKLSDFYTDT